MAREERLSNGELFVTVPGVGFVPRSLVVRVPEGMRLHRQHDGEIVGFDRDGIMHRFDPPSAEALAWQRKRRGGIVEPREEEEEGGATGGTGSPGAAGIEGPMDAESSGVDAEVSRGPTGPTGATGPPGPAAGATELAEEAPTGPGAVGAE